MKEDQGLWRGRIVCDRGILAGKPIVKGTLIAVDVVLEELSHNPDIGELLAAHPDLNRDDVRACLSYARAIVAGERIHSLNSRKPPISAGAYSKIIRPIISEGTPRMGMSILAVLSILLIAIFLIYVKQW